MKNIEFFVAFIVYWILTIIYCLRWHYKEGNLKTPTILLSIFLGPVLFLVLVDSNMEMKKIERENKRMENENRQSNERHISWLRTMSGISRNTLPSFGRTVPPPISRPRVNQEEVRSEWRRENGINKLKDFKFFQK